MLIDELGYLTLKPEQANAFFRLMDQRYGRVSTIITTNLDLPDWYDLFDKKPLVDALLDRLQHHCITIRIDGPSLRSPEPPGVHPSQSAASRDQDKSTGGRRAIILQPSPDARRRPSPARSLKWRQWPSMTLQARGGLRRR